MDCIRGPVQSLLAAPPGRGIQNGTPTGPTRLTCRATYSRCQRGGQESSAARGAQRRDSASARLAAHCQQLMGNTRALRPSQCTPSHIHRHHKCSSVSPRALFTGESACRVPYSPVAAPICKLYPAYKCCCARVSVPEVRIVLVCPYQVRVSQQNRCAPLGLLAVHGSGRAEMGSLREEACGGRDCGGGSAVCCLCQWMVREMQCYGQGVVMWVHGGIGGRDCGGDGGQLCVAFADEC